MPDRYLALSPEQGGTCFGPFPSGTLCVGTDNRTCRVVLGPMPGLRPIHAQITFSPDGRAFLQPGDRAAALWVHSRSGQVSAVDGSAALQLGDAFSLGSPQGPRFIVCDVPPLQTVRQAPPPPPPPGAGGVTQHMRRDERYQTRGATMAGDLTRGAVQDMARMKEESKTSPLFIVLAVLGVGGIFAGTCAGLAAGIWAWTQQ